MLKGSKGEKIIYHIVNPVIKLMIKLGVTPNLITSIGLFFNILASAILIVGAEQSDRHDMRYLGWSGFIVLFAGLFDMIDGRLARLGNMSSDFGAFYDSVIDRYSELFMYLGISYFLISHDYFVSSLMAVATLMGSMMVSYTRSRAEGLNIECSVGFMQRGLRIVITGSSAMFCGVYYYLSGYSTITIDSISTPVFETISIFALPLTFVAIMSNQTAIARLIHVKKELNKM